MHMLTHEDTHTLSLCLGAWLTDKSHCLESPSKGLGAWFCDAANSTRLTLPSEGLGLWLSAGLCP